MLIRLLCTYRTTKCISKIVCLKYITLKFQAIAEKFAKIPGDTFTAPGTQYSVRNIPMTNSMNFSLHWYSVDADHSVHCRQCRWDTRRCIKLHSKEKLMRSRLCCDIKLIPMLSLPLVMSFALCILTALCFILNRILLHMFGYLFQCAVVLAVWRKSGHVAMH